MPQSYTVLSTRQELRHEIEVKKSRFLTVLRRVDTEVEAADLLADLRREFHDARHHCSAWVLGADRHTRRSSDDGEPSGTAGAPMLEAITLRRTGLRAGDAEDTDLSDVAAVVVRWFGGTLLGAGGLVRAYSDSVSQALDRVELTRRERLRVFTVSAPLTEAARWENELRGSPARVLGTQWHNEGATLEVAVPDAAHGIESLRTHIGELSAGTAVLELTGTRWVDAPSS